MTIQDKADAVDRLYHNKDFQMIVLDDFVNQGILDVALRENVSSEAVQAQLKARKILIDYFYDIINSAEMLKLDNEDN
jgi:hypothetical protein